MRFDRIELLIRTIESAIKDLESCSVFEDNDLKREKMLSDAAALKEFVALFESLCYLE